MRALSLSSARVTRAPCAATEGEVVDRASKKKPAAAKMDGTDVEAGEACETTQQL